MERKSVCVCIGASARAWCFTCRLQWAVGRGRVWLGQVRVLLILLYIFFLFSAHTRRHPHTPTNTQTHTHTLSLYLSASFSLPPFFICFPTSSLSSAEGLHVSFNITLYLTFYLACHYEFLFIEILLLISSELYTDWFIAVLQMNILQLFKGWLHGIVLPRDEPHFQPTARIYPQTSGIYIYMNFSHIYIHIIRAFMRSVSPNIAKNLWICLYSTYHFSHFLFFDVQNRLKKSMPSELGISDIYLKFRWGRERERKKKRGREKEESE